MAELHEVHVEAEPLDGFGTVIGEQRTVRLLDRTAAARHALSGRIVWNLNSTAAGGGVAEMLQVLLAYERSGGIDARWLVIDGEPAFYAITKRLHNRLHGSAGDGRELDDTARAVYERVTAENAAALLELVQPGDVIMLHDPQTAGMLPALRERDVKIIWRCHVGADIENDHVKEAQSFLRPYLEDADAYVFSRRPHVHGWIPEDKLRIIPPSIDPFSPKNQPLDASTVRAVLRRIGLLPENGEEALFRRRDGSPGHVVRSGQLTRSGATPDPDTPLVVQVSRWDRLKDMTGVLEGFAEHVPEPAHLALVGPSVEGVADDPEGAEVLDDCAALWDGLPANVQQRAHLVTLPMADLDENAVMVNAVQRHASVVVQKSLQEGFGLTVAEAMFKTRPMVASRVGGIQDQIEHGEQGLLIDDPRDIDALGRSVARLLDDAELAARLGHAARERVLDNFVGDRHLVQLAELWMAVTGRGSSED